MHTHSYAYAGGPVACDAHLLYVLLVCCSCYVCFSFLVLTVIGFAFILAGLVLAFETSSDGKLVREQGVTAYQEAIEVSTRTTQHSTAQHSTTSERDGKTHRTAHAPLSSNGCQMPMWQLLVSSAVLPSASRCGARCVLPCSVSVLFVL